MSSYICSPKHFVSIEKNLPKLTEHRYFPAMVREELGIHQGHTSRRDKAIKELVNNWRALNVLCVSYQYQHHYEGKLDEEIRQQFAVLDNNRKDFKELTIRGLYNALTCLYYQIEIEHIDGIRNDLKPAFKQLEKLIDLARKVIVDDLPSDETCTWSID